MQSSSRLSALEPHQRKKLLELFAAADTPRLENKLAFSGDKRLYLTTDEKAVIAYADKGRYRIAMGPPIGDRASWVPAVKMFGNMAATDGLRPVIYSAAPGLTQELSTLGFATEKIGENAILGLADFSLAGRKREGIRRAHRKLNDRTSATFEISSPPHAEDLLTDLRRVSDIWLNVKHGSERGFSVGCFAPHFLNGCPIGIARINGQIVAFASLLTTPNKHWAGIDLMRFDPTRAVTNTMDYLLIELIFWAKNQSYQIFDLAMAPLSGLGEAGDSLYSRIGHKMFEHGERFYNFKGLRRFKQKFDPEWEPRFVITPKRRWIPQALIQVSRLTAGEN